MSPIFLALVLVLLVAQFALPKRWAFVPILIAAFNVGNVELAGELTLTRILILAGVVRAAASGSLSFGFKNPMDRVFILFAFFAILSAPFHNPPFNPYIERLGLIYNVVGTYVYGRAFLTGEDIVRRIALGSLVALLPLAVLMTMEFITGRNGYYPHFGGRGAFAQFREGFRARGPFGHAILAGTAGAVTICFFFQFWRERKKIALLGICGCLAIAFSSNSSGPIAATLFALGVVYLWRWRQYVPYAKWMILGGIVFLSLYMNRPFYFIIDSIDFTGGSTGWHRARLIESSLQKLNEWWLFGTDYTRHWMPTGVSWNPDHTDLTNYYLHLGVLGGLPLTLLLIAMIWLGVKKLLAISFALESQDRSREAFATWCIIGALLAHASSFISISYFDQMFVLFYLLIAMIANLTIANVAQAEYDEDHEPRRAMAY